VTVLRSGSATDVGLVRTSNQDLAIETGTLFAVADGMGGHAGGEVASRLAIDSLQAAFSRHPTGSGLAEAVTVANDVVWQHSIESAELRGMGTTLAAVAQVDEDGRDVLALVNVGDSRVYRFHQGELTQVTKDHSLAEEMVLSGELTPAEAMVHPHRHILTRALGVSPDVDVDLWRIRPERGDRFLLCSDGLTNELGDSQIVELLSTIHDPQEAADLLVEAARGHGGSDNITAVVVDVVIGEEDTGSTPAVAAVSTDFTPVPVDRPTGPTQLVPPPDTSAPSARQRRRTKRQERRRARGRRLVTFRTFLFLVLFAAIVVGALFAVRWYNDNSYYVGLSSDGKDVTIYQGRIGGLLWYHPRVVERTTLTAADLTQVDAPNVKAGVQESSLQNAKNYVNGLRSDYRSTHTTTSTLPPPTTTTTTTVPGATTTTVPGAITTTTSPG
jgi:serine/threonine protein phosphatase PrpC